MEENKVKLIQVLSSNILHRLVKEANNLGITKDDIISLNKSEGEYHLTYYK